MVEVIVGIAENPNSNNQATSLNIRIHENKNQTCVCQEAEGIEIVFVSSDRSAEDMTSYMKVIKA